MSKYYLYVDSPTPIFKARVNMASIAYPLTALTFDTVTLGAYTDLIPDQTLLLGSIEGADDLGRVRVQNFATSSNIPIGRISQGREDGTLDVSDDVYITVLNDYRVWAKIPVMTLEESISTFKDSDIPPLSYNDEIPPKANAGPFMAGFVDPGTNLLTVQFPLGGVNQSFAIAEGATLTDYLWDVEDGTITVGTSASSVITATFPVGKRWVGLTVTDSNGKVHTTRAFVLAIDPDDDTYTYKNWNNANLRYTQDGTTLEVEINNSLLRGTYPDGTLVLLWKDEPADPGDRSHMKFVGWLDTEDWGLRGSKKGLTKVTTLRCVDIANRMKQLPGFPQALERSDEVGWEFMPDLDMNKALNYLIAWHTTAYSLADVILPLSGASYDAMRIDTGASSILDQLASTGKKMVPAHVLTCNPMGQIIFIEDWMEIDEGDRPASTLILLEEDLSEIRANYNRQAKAHSLSTGAILSSTDWVTVGGEETVPTVFSKAPGDSFSQGMSELIESEGLALSQEDLNDATGHRYARHNARYAPFQITFSRIDNIWDYIPAYMERVELQIVAMYAAWRGLDFEQAFGMVKDMTIRLQASNQGFVTSASLSWERETFGTPGITVIPEDTDESEETEPVTPLPTDPIPLPGLTDVLAGISYDGFVYRTENFQDASPTWDEVDLSITGTLYSWVVDPFSPGYIDGVGEVNGWVVNDTDIYRIEDLFGTPTKTSVFTFGTATVGASFHWRSIQASFGAFFAEGINPWLMCVSYYGSTGGHTGTWVTYSTDGGVTWSTETQISAHYNTTAATRFNPIGVYLSPKTPGLAYTAAYSETAADAQAIGKKSTNWGASWSDYATIDPGSGNAGTIHIPWPNNDAENTIYHGQLITTVEAGTPPELMPDWKDRDDAGIDTPMDAGPSQTLTHSFTPPLGTSDLLHRQLIIVPPAGAVRFIVVMDWTALKEREGFGASVSLDLNTVNGVGVNHTGSTNWSAPPTYGVPTSGGGTLEFNCPSGVWPSNGPAFDMVISALSGSGNLATGTITVNATITEIELDDETVYTPTLGTGERSFRLKRIVAGSVLDISPVDGSVLFGTNRGHFGVRSYDSNRQYMVAAVMGNDVSGDPDDDQHALYISDDFGVTFTEVIAPFADSLAPVGRPALEAAFSGTSEQIIFIWGLSAYMKYSDDFGATVDDKSGNLAALGSAGFIGIAGGPTG